MLVVPLIEHLLGQIPRPNAVMQAKLTVNLPSQAGREDWWPVKLILPEDRAHQGISQSHRNRKGKSETSTEEGLLAIPSFQSDPDQEYYYAEPIFGKSNLIFTLAAADGLLRIPPDATGMSAGEVVEVFLV